jgi:hypothetical protein
VPIKKKEIKKMTKRRKIFYLQQFKNQEMLFYKKNKKMAIPPTTLRSVHPSLIND